MLSLAYRYRAQDRVPAQRGLGSASSWILFLAFLLGPGTAALHAQSYLQNIGVPNLTTAIPVENGSISVTNGCLHVEIPMGLYPQRGGRQTPVTLVYDSSIWTPKNPWSPTNFYDIDTYWNGWGGWRVNSPRQTGWWDANDEWYDGWCAAIEDSKYIHYDDWYYIEVNGTRHDFPDVDLVTLNDIENCTGTIVSSDEGYASDGSGVLHEGR